MGLFPIHLLVVVVLAEVGRTGTKSRRGTSFHSRDLGRTFEGKSSSNDSLADKICFFSLRTRVVAWPSPVVGVRRVAHADPRPLKRNRGETLYFTFLRGKHAWTMKVGLSFFTAPLTALGLGSINAAVAPQKTIIFLGICLHLCSCSSRILLPRSAFAPLSKSDD